MQRLVRTQRHVCVPSPPPCDRTRRRPDQSSSRRDRPPERPTMPSPSSFAAEVESPRTGLDPSPVAPCGIKGNAAGQISNQTTSGLFFCGRPQKLGRLTIDISRLLFPTEENGFCYIRAEIKLRNPGIESPQDFVLPSRKGGPKKAAASSILALALSKHPIKKVRRSRSQLGSSKKRRSSGGSDGGTASHHQAQEYF